MSKVAVLHCNDYNKDDVYNSIKRGIDLLGGFDTFIKHDEKILLKPNMLRAHEPDKATTTHPVIFEAVIRLLQENNYSISYGDSPGFGSPQNVAQVTGLDAIAQKYHVPLLDFENGEIVSFPQGKQTKQFEIAKGVLQSDALISLPKMKSHQLTRITGAVKNQLGCVFGLNKAAFHIKFPNPVDFSRMLTDLNNLVKTRLYIMDGIVAMEGNGPASGNPKKMGVILISDDPVAMDAAFCKLIDLNPDFVPILRFGKESGLGNYENIEYCGDSLDVLINRSFDVVRSPVKDETLFGFLSPLKNLLIRRPVIDTTICKKCGICVEACPVNGKALFQKTKTDFPYYNYKKCIRCYCCQEMCPHKAIKVKIPFFGKLLFYRK